MIVENLTFYYSPNFVEKMKTLEYPLTYSYANGALISSEIRPRIVHLVKVFQIMVMLLSFSGSFLGTILLLKSWQSLRANIDLVFNVIQTNTCFCKLVVFHIRQKEINKIVQTLSNGIFLPRTETESTISDKWETLLK